MCLLAIFLNCCTPERTRKYPQIIPRIVRINCGFFWVKKAYKLYGIGIFDHFLTNFIGKKYQN